MSLGTDRGLVRAVLTKVGDTNVTHLQTIQTESGARLDLVDDDYIGKNIKIVGSAPQVLAAEKKLNALIKVMHMTVIFLLSEGSVRSNGSTNRGLCIFKHRRKLDLR